MSAFAHNLRPLPRQYEALRWITADDDAGVKILAFLGAWGSAKTSGAAQSFFVACARSPWREAYGQTNPRSALIAPTLSIARQATLTQLLQFCPREFILRHRGHPHNDLLLANGHLIELHSGKGELDGQNYTNVWIDEIHHRAFGHRKFMNYQARARDPLQPRHLVIASGLPESGWVQETFDRPESPSRKTLLLSTSDNPFITPEVMAELLASCPAGEEAYYLRGGWHAVRGAIYPQFSAATHIVDRGHNPRAPVHVSMDVGNQASVLFGQDIAIPLRNIVGQTSPGKGLLIVGQMQPENMSVDQICYQIKTRTEFHVVPGRSTICVDPTTDRDELAAIRKHFPGVRVVRRERGEDTYSVDTGIRLVKRALRDALGNTRLFFSRTLVGAPRGILEAIPRYKTAEGSDAPIKDNTYDHALDSMRYLVCEMLPAERIAPTVRK